MELTDLTRKIQKFNNKYRNFNCFHAPIVFRDYLYFVHPLNHFAVRVRLNLGHGINDYSPISAALGGIAVLGGMPNLSDKLLRLEKVFSSENYIPSGKVNAKLVMEAVSYLPKSPIVGAHVSWKKHADVHFISFSQFEAEAVIAGLSF